jgi:2-aminoethylphosphonate aminotransferase
MKRNILLNPGPGTTSQTVKAALVVPDICPRENEFGMLMDGIRKDLVRVVHGGDEYTAVLFTASGTGGVEAAITSAVPRGKKMLVVENGAYGTRMAEIAGNFGIETVRYRIPYGDYPDIDTIEELIRQHSGLSHLAVVHHETTTGMLNPVEQIAEVAAKQGLDTIVNAISSFAGLPINAGRMNATYLVSTSNKCIQGMPGLAFVVCRKDALEKLTPGLRSFYLDLPAQHRYFEEHLQTRFTPPVQVIYALRQALNEYFTETEQGRHQRYRENWNLLYNGMTGMGFRPLLDPRHESGILTAFCEPPDPSYSFNEMHDFLFSKGYTIYPGKGAAKKTFRLSVLGDLHPADISGFLNAMQEWVSEKKIEFRY